MKDRIFIERYSRDAKTVIDDDDDDDDEIKNMWWNFHKITAESDRALDPRKKKHWAKKRDEKVAFFAFFSAPSFNIIGLKWKRTKKNLFFPPGLQFHRSFYPRQ